MQVEPTIRGTICIAIKETTMSSYIPSSCCIYIIHCTHGTYPQANSKNLVVQFGAKCHICHLIPWKWNTLCASVRFGSNRFRVTTCTRIILRKFIFTLTNVKHGKYAGLSQGNSDKAELASTIHQANVDSMFSQRRRRWLNIKSTLGRSSVKYVISLVAKTSSLFTNKQSGDK